MTKRQPTLKEAARLIEYGWLGSDWIEAKWSKSGKTIVNWIKYSSNPIVSDITHRCFDCQCALQDRRDGVGSYIINADNPNAFIQGRYSENERVNVCISCFNRRLPRTRAMIEWNKNRKFINKVKGKLYEHRKDSRTVARTSIADDGRRKKQ
jgi:hypothetical protein